MMPATARSHPASRAPGALPRSEVSAFLHYPGLNLLMEGPDCYSQATLVAVYPQLTRPVTAWVGTPPPIRSGTLLVCNVERLVPEEQRLLFEWLEQTSGGVRVIATTTKRLFPEVGRGAFLEPLYYRLNMVRVEIPDGH